jgi:hypothetical protein
MRKYLLGLTFAAISVGSFAVPAIAADYREPPRPQPYYPPPPPPQVYYQPPVQSSCCCPTVRRGFLNFNFFSSCGGYGYQNYGAYPQYEYQPAPAYYQQQQSYPAYQQYQYGQPGYGAAVIDYRLIESALVSDDQHMHMADRLLVPFPRHGAAYGPRH